MTKKIHVHLIDDLDASEASETVRFEVDGRTYEIDLSSRNAQRFRTEIAPYIAHARRVITHARRPGRAGTGSGPPPRGRARAAPRGSARPRGGPAEDITEGETGLPGYDGGLPPRADFGGAVLDGRPAGAGSGDEEHAPS
jgi:Lsr2